MAAGYASATIRAWKQGECLVFDDSFEHEVFHDGNADRIVLICDCWHPQVDVDTMVVPLLSQIACGVRGGEGAAAFADGANAGGAREESSRGRHQVA